MKNDFGRSAILFLLGADVSVEKDVAGIALETTEAASWNADAAAIAVSSAILMAY
jgi:hypothetical protein